jgi:hypothetical protein
VRLHSLEEQQRAQFERRRHAGGLAGDVLRADERQLRMFRTDGKPARDEQEAKRHVAEEESRPRDDMLRLHFGREGSRHQPEMQLQADAAALYAARWRG